MQRNPEADLLGLPTCGRLPSSFNAARMAGVEIAHPAALRSQVAVGDKVTKRYPAIRP